MDIPVQLHEIYEAYARKLAQAHKNSSIFAGLFGQGSMKDARSDTCNQEFYENTAQWVASFSGSNPDPQQVFAVCKYVLEAASISNGKPTYWYHLVAQAHVKCLIPMLNRDDCGILLENYLKWYPKRQQLPLQREMTELLKKHSEKESE